jgi:hypothetical protein
MCTSLGGQAIRRAKSPASDIDCATKLNRIPRLGRLRLRGPGSAQDEFTLSAIS